MRQTSFWGAALLLLTCVRLGSGETPGAGDSAAQTFFRAAPISAASRQNPYAGQRDAALAGRKLYLRNCSHCHGKDGRGHSKAANLGSSAIKDAPPGVIFWWIKNGNLRADMPAWSHLPDPRIWQVVTYIQTSPQD